MPQQRDPDRALFWNALAVGLKEPSARRISQLTKKEVEAMAAEDPDKFHVVKRAGALARGAPHLVAEPEPMPEEQWPTYLRLLMAGKRPSQAAGEMGVEPMTVYLARQASVRFQDLERAAESAITEQVEDTMLTAALEGDTKAAQFWLENRSPERWGSGKKGGGVNIGTLNVNVSPDEMRARVEAIRAELGVSRETDVVDAEVVE